jgi:hypothetical protein
MFGLRELVRRVGFLSDKFRMRELLLSSGEDIGQILTPKAAELIVNYCFSCQTKFAL